MSRKNNAKQTYKKLYGDKVILPYDQDYEKIMNNYIYGDVYNQVSLLDDDQKELILIVANVTSHTLKPIRQHTQAALMNQVSAVKIKEAIYQCTPYVGYGKVQDALEVVNEVMKEENITLPLKDQSTVDEDTRFHDGFEVQSRAFGREHIQAGHDNAPTELKHIQNYLSEYCFGDFYTRTGLNLQERELLTFVMLASLGGCENQLRAHTQANLTVGNSRDMLIHTITLCQPYIGFPRTLNAIQIINEVTQ